MCIGRTRVLEMRYPRRDVDKDHNPKLSQYLASLIKCNNDAELLIGVYFVTKEALITSYEGYLQDADPLDDAPTVAFMKGFVAQIHEQISEAKIIFAQLPENNAPNVHDKWKIALQTYLSNIGGLLVGAKETTDLPVELATRSEYIPPIVPRRDPKFTPAVYHLPDVDPHRFIDLQIFQGINHVNEIWAAEIPALVMWKWNDMPWEFYLNCSRWAFDESRHCMMGEERMKVWGFEVGIDYPVVADHYISVSNQGELAVLALLHRFETGGGIWKSGLKEQFEKLGDTASSQDFDYDWADESIHLAYGHKWVLHRLGGDMEAFEDLKEETMATWNDWHAKKRKEYDYEPFASRIKNKIAEIVAKNHG